MHRLVPSLVSQMGQHYPELTRAQALIEETLKLEETRFRQTLDRGLKLLDEELTDLPDGAELPGRTAFKLYDTYGFPLDLTQDALREKGRAVETAGFDEAMEEQKAKARAAWSGSGEAADNAVWFDIADSKGATDFLGYDTEKAEGQVIALIVDGARAEKIAEGGEGWVVVNQTPFYGESGGQVGDTGVIRRLEDRDEVALVEDTRKFADGKITAHKVTMKRGEMKLGDPVELEVDHTRRSTIRANHSATHLLHEALRRALGDHVAQRGSLNAPDRLRFDFSHSKGLTLEELKQVEEEVNAFIRQNSAVETRIMTPDDARGLGAQALFGEKYGDEVRVVSMGQLAGSGKGMGGETYSLELCGGTHVRQTGDIGVFVALGDSASSAGVRRIEALTGAAAFDYLSGQDHRLAQVASVLKAQPGDVTERVQALLAERRALENEVAQLRKQLAMAGGGGGAAPADRDVNGITFLAQVLEGVTGKDLPGLIDEHKARMGDGSAVLLMADAGGKVAVAAGVSDDLTGRVSAVDLLKAAVVELGGKGGGGRPDMAQGGGKDIGGAEAAIAAAENLLKGV
jgi:alanyl-tRNA synthetase